MPTHIYVNLTACHGLSYNLCFLIYVYQWDMDHVLAHNIPLKSWPNWHRQVDGHPFKHTAEAWEGWEGTRIIVLTMAAWRHASFIRLIISISSAYVPSKYIYVLFGGMGIWFKYITSGQSAPIEYGVHYLWALHFPTGLAWWRHDVETTLSLLSRGSTGHWMVPLAKYHQCRVPV